VSYTVKKIEGEPVILIQFHTDFDAHTEAQKAFEASAQLLSEQTEPVFTIWDVRKSVSDLQSIMEGANVSRTNATHPNERGSIVVTDNEIVKLAMQGLNSEVYGNVVIPVFEDIDGALAYVRQQIGKP
jgi:hypothetical protein